MCDEFPACMSNPQRLCSFNDFFYDVFNGFFLMEKPAERENCSVPVFSVCLLGRWCNESAKSRKSPSPNSNPAKVPGVLGVRSTVLQGHHGPSGAPGFVVSTSAAAFPAR